MRNKKVCIFIAVITAIAAAISGAAFFMKRHRRKSRFIALVLVAAAMFGVMGLSTTIYAKDFPPCEENGGEYADCAEYTQDYKPNNAGVELIAGEEITIPALPIDPAPEQEDTEEPTSPQTLTPPGNMNLVDDFSGELAQDKQFITVVTRNGHFFYIVIDRAAERQNVHFLNQVDEYSLWAILEDEARPRPAPVEPMPEVMPTPEADPAPTEPEAEQGGGIGGLLIMIVLLGAVGGGAYYYFKVLKPQQGAKGTTPAEIDEFVFDEDEEDYSGGSFGDYGGASDGAEGEDDIPDFTATEPESEDE